MVDPHGIRGLRRPGETILEREGPPMPPMEAPVLTKMTRLPSESFRANRKTASVDVSDIVRRRPSPHWYSPSATNQNDADADTLFIQELRNLGNWDYAQKDHGADG